LDDVTIRVGAFCFLLLGAQRAADKTVRSCPGDACIGDETPMTSKEDRAQIAAAVFKLSTLLAGHHKLADHCPYCDKTYRRMDNFDGHGESFL